MYKRGQGMSSRMGAVVLGVLLGFYAGYSWYMYFFPSETELVDHLLHYSFLGGVILFAGMGYMSLRITMFQAKSVDYLIDMDGELRKVVWPAVQPLFDPKTEAWGSTYVVIGCTVFLTVYIAMADVLLQKSITEGLLTVLFRR